MVIDEAMNEFQHAAERLHDDMQHLRAVMEQLEHIKTYFEGSAAQVMAAMESLNRTYREESERNRERLEQMTAEDREFLRNRIIE